MRTVLLSNITHYHYLARALYEGGHLRRYVTAMSPHGASRLPGILPQYWRQKLSGRKLLGIPKDRVRQLWLPELLQKFLPSAHICSNDRANWVNDTLFDGLASRGIARDCEALHFVSGVGLRSARIAKRQGATIICDVRQEHPAFQKHLLAEEWKRLGIAAAFRESVTETRVLEEFQLADFFVVPSAHAKRTFVDEDFPAERIFVLPYGVDVQFKPQCARDTVFRVLYVGTLTARKGVQYLLEAFKRLQLPNSELMLVGPVDPPFQPILAKYSGVFRYLGPVPKISLGGVYSASSVFVLPSLADSFGLVALEAMACNLPVLVTHNTGAADIITDGREGFVLPIRDAAAIQEKLTLLFERSALREAMGIAAGRLARSCSWDAYGRKALRLYENLQSGTLGDGPRTSRVGSASSAAV